MIRGGKAAAETGTGLALEWRSLLRQGSRGSACTTALLCCAVLLLVVVVDESPMESNKAAVRTPVSVCCIADDCVGETWGSGFAFVSPPRPLRCDEPLGVGEGEGL